MAEVRVKIGADIKDLQKGVRDAQQEVSALGKTAQTASGSLSGTAKSIEEIKASARAAIAESKALRAELDGVADASGNVSSAAGQLGNDLEGGFAGGARAAASFASKIAGGVGLAFLITTALELKDRFVEAFTAGDVAAEKAKATFEGVFASISDFSRLRGEVRVFESRDDIIRTANIAKREIAAIESQLEAAGSTASRSDGLFGLVDAQTLDNITRTTLGFFSEAQKQNNILIDILKEKRGEQEGELAVLTKQLEAYDNRIKAGLNSAEAELRTRKEIEGQVSALKEAQKASEDLLKLRAQAFAAVGAPTPFVQRGRTPQAAAPLPGQPGRVFDETAATAASDFAFSLGEIENILGAGLITGLQAANEQFDIMRARLFEMAAQGLNDTEAYKQLNAEFLKLGQQLQTFNDAAFATDVFSNLAVDGLEAVVNVKLGFQDAASAVDSLRQTVQGLIGDLARAALKAAILAGISKALGFATGGASAGFGGFFRTALGIGSLGAAPSQSIINAPAAVAPLGRLAQASQSAQVVIPELTIRGNDLVVAFQRARAGSARTLGNIPLK